MRSHRPGLVASVLAAASIALCAAPSPARAQNAADQAVARSLFDEGSRLYAAADYPAACAKLEASYHLFAGIGTRGKLAECYEKVGRTASAWAMYREVAVLAGKAGDSTRERVANERAAALEPTLAHLTIELPAASDAPGLVIKRAGEQIDRGAIGTAVPVDPGTIPFEFSAPGRVTQTSQVTVAPGATVTVTVPALAAAPAAAPEASPAPAATPAAPGTGESAPASGQPSPGAWQRPAAYVVGGAGIVAAAVGGVLALAAKSSYDGAFSSGHCDHASLTCDSTGQSQTSGARTQADVGGVLFGVGLALVVGGGVLFFTAPSGDAARTTTGLHLSPQLGPRQASLSVDTTF